MFRNIVILLIVLSSFPGMAQKVVEARQTEERKGLVYLKGDNTPFTGMAVTWFPSGKKQIEAPYLVGKENGVETSWFPDGKVMMEITYRDGEFNGSYKFYYVEGGLEYEKMYSGGLMNGPSTHYYHDGKKWVIVQFFHHKRLNLRLASTIYRL